MFEVQFIETGDTDSIWTPVLSFDFQGFLVSECGTLFCRTVTPSCILSSCVVTVTLLYSVCRHPMSSLYTANFATYVEHVFHIKLEYTFYMFSTRIIHRYYTYILNVKTCRFHMN